MYRAEKVNTDNLRDTFQPWLHINGQEVSYKDQAVDLCSDPKHKCGVQCANDKYLKRTNGIKIKEIHYFSIKRAK